MSVSARAMTERHKRLFLSKHPFTFISNLEAFINHQFQTNPIFRECFEHQISKPNSLLSSDYIIHTQKLVDVLIFENI